MSIVNIVAKLRFKYYSNMLDIVNVANQLHILNDKKADLMNKHNLKECFKSMDIQGYKLPEEFKSFMNEEES